MSRTSFVHAHAAHADWRVALAECLRQVQTQPAARIARQDDSATLTLGWCYLSDCYAAASEGTTPDLQDVAIR